MHCERCSGLMSYEGFYGWGSEVVWYYPGWRCVHCGEVMDSIISLNRRLNSEHHTNGNGNGHTSHSHLSLMVGDDNHDSNYAGVLYGSEDDY